MPPGKNPNSAPIKIGKYIVNEYASGADDFKIEDLLKVGELGAKRQLEKVMYTDFRGYFKIGTRGESFVVDLSAFIGESNSQAAFLKDFSEFVSILESQAKPKERRG